MTVQGCGCVYVFVCLCVCVLLAFGGTSAILLRVPRTWPALSALLGRLQSSTPSAWNSSTRAGAEGTLLSSFCVLLRCQTLGERFVFSHHHTLMIESPQKDQLQSMLGYSEKICIIFLIWWARARCHPSVLPPGLPAVKPGGWMWYSTSAPPMEKSNTQTMCEILLSCRGNVWLDQFKCKAAVFWSFYALILRRICTVCGTSSVNAENQMKKTHRFPWFKVCWGNGRKKKGWQAGKEVGEWRDEAETFSLNGKTADCRR